MEETAEEILTGEIDIIGTVRETINSLCNSLFNSISDTLFPLLDDIVFIDGKVLETKQFEKFFGTSASSGVLTLANLLITAFVLYYCGRLIISHFTGNSIDSPYKFFIRTLIVVVFMNCSFALCQYMLNMVFDISSFFLELGEDLFKEKISFITFTNEMKNFSNNEFDVFSIDGILSSTLYLSSFSLVLNFALRYVLIKVLTILSPFFFLCLINQNTEHFFKNYLRCLFSLLILQVFVSVILVLPFILIKETSNTMFNKILLIGTISALLKSNQTIREIIGGLDITANIQSGISGLKSMFAK